MKRRTIPLLLIATGGSFIFAEMHSDGETAAEMTSVLVHHWVADVDRALGGLHDHTLPRQELADQIESMGLRKIKYTNAVSRQSDPMDSERLQQLEDTIAGTIERAKGADSYKELKADGEVLRRRLHEVGAQGEPRLYAIGRK